MFDLADVLRWLKVNSWEDALWVGFGLIAQLMFMMRFAVQWIASERARRSLIPVAFWYFSMAGGLMLLTYGIARGEPVIIIGQATGLVIYGRNLYLIHRERHENRKNLTAFSPAPPAEPSPTMARADD